MPSSPALLPGGEGGNLRSPLAADTSGGRRRKNFLAGSRYQSQDSAPPVWYSVTLVSKKFFSFFRSIISLIQGKGLLAPG